MSFTSIAFLLIALPIFMLVYYIVPTKFKPLALFLASFLFYAYNEPFMILGLLILTWIHYDWGVLLFKNHEKPTVKKVILIAAVVIDVSLLVAVKLTMKQLPLGISVFVFTAISYVVDVYKDAGMAEPSFIRFFDFLAMFPKVQQGPITRYEQVKKQLNTPDISLENFDLGLKQFIFGMSMKILVADRLAFLWSDISTLGYISISTRLAWLTAIGFSIQLYLDFWGYTMMAQGVGLMLGYHLPDNFDSPYASKSIREFYRKWHMTLGKWFTDYVYIPCGGSKGSLLATIRNIMLVWLLTSFWHGMSLNFLIWGLGIGVFICIERLVTSYAKKKADTDEKKASIFKEILSHVYVILVITVSWVCFAITNMKQLGIYLRRMFHIGEGKAIQMGDYINYLKVYWPYLLVGAFLCTPLAAKLIKKLSGTWVSSIAAAALFWVCIYYIHKSGNNPFMYLNF